MNFDKVSFNLQCRKESFGTKSSLWLAEGKRCSWDARPWGAGRTRLCEPRLRRADPHPGACAVAQRHLQLDLTPELFCAEIVQRL